MTNIYKKRLRVAKLTLRDSLFAAQKFIFYFPWLFVTLYLCLTFLLCKGEKNVKKVEIIWKEKIKNVIKFWREFFSLASSRPLLQCPVTLSPPPHPFFLIKAFGKFIVFILLYFLALFLKTRRPTTRLLIFEKYFFEKIKIKQKAEQVQAMFLKQVPLCRVFFLVEQSEAWLGQVCLRVFYM